MDLQRQLETATDRNRSLEDEHKHRIASFVKRETQTKNKIESLERRLNEGTDQDLCGEGDGRGSLERLEMINANNSLCSHKLGLG